MPARIIPIEAAFEVAGHGGETPTPFRTQPDRVELQRRHAEKMEELPQLREMLNQG